MNTILEAVEDSPRSRSETGEWFATKEDCLSFLDELRWGDGFTWPACGHTERCRMADGQSLYMSCRKQTSITTGTTIEKACTPLWRWFAAG